ncbi:metal ABC transporter solute-binding protein, Zn/Mn family [Peribacillus castrilensis]|uniref:Manganese ABC transporter manganese binding lipoprotein n=1 Tax=Peribacillus simplex TaxID=1478 RepID=A0AAN2PDC8_9BACI|nr:MULTISPECIES: zinc ABC transporter substrate-binding protein [Bacillaceae]MCP1095720.1 zinc ABC transporter substrate-binding protein [Bacillaceae bacterium OS4b]MBD8586501.1 zinc ABC transporter substrate-binding protein [Peribacillus simplex]MCF7625036.1 zinc ABC transporter substrate-binding protein [Peribacillus frigoritolerans]MEA3574074.1 zinc ABC transporter substrate-binding protein [Peribacillus frigoritolerans]NCT36196.1 zinc ABC transporter solute-binding protein [Peribacillus fr
MGFLKSIGGVLAALLVLTGCGNDTAESDNGNGKLDVVTTTGMIGDLVENIGGKHVEVSSLMGPGVDPHLYKATQGDVKTLDSADMIFYNGLHLEGKMTDIFEMMSKDKPTIAVTEDFKENQLRKVGATEHDPHVWFDVKLWIVAAEAVKKELIAKDPDHEAEYRENYEEYVLQLEELDKYVHEEINKVPEDQRVLVTAHDAFGYYGQSYGLDVRGLQGINTLSEYGSKDVTDMRNYLVENKIKAIFIESSVPRKAIEAVIQGAGKQGHKVEIGGELFSDAMGERGTEEGTYIGMVRHNTDTIVRALK